MSIFRSRKSPAESTEPDAPISLDDAKLQEDLEDIIDIQKEETKKASLQAQQDEAVRQQFREEAYEELTDTSESHLYLRAAQELLKSDNIQVQYQQVIKLAIAYVRIGEVAEALHLIDILDLPTEQYTQAVDWIQVVENKNPFSYYPNKEKKRKTKLLRWKFQDSIDDDFEYQPRSLFFDQNTEESVVAAATERTQSNHERRFKSQLKLSESNNMTELQGMSPREYVLAMVAYYSNWHGNISTVENVKKFASTLQDPDEDFEIDKSEYQAGDNKRAYDALKERYEKKGPSVLKKVIETGVLTGAPNSEMHAERKIPRIVILNFLIDLAEQKYKQNPHDIVDDEDKDLIGV